MSYALATLWHERQRFLPGIFAVAFSALLIALQCGLLLGLLSVTSIPVDYTRADLWIGGHDVLSVDQGVVIPMSFIGRLHPENPEIDASSIEPFIEQFGKWKKPTGGTQICVIIGGNLEDNACGAVKALTPDLRQKLTEPDSVVVDKSELKRLGLTEGVGQYGNILDTKVRVVGLVTGYKSLAGPYIFCSVKTARKILRMRDDQTIFLLARCKDPKNAPVVVKRLRDKYENVSDPQQQRDMSALTSSEFSWKSQMHWLRATMAGVAIGYTAILGLLVGAVVTSQTLYAATVASIRELAILRALGIPRWRMISSVVTQSFYVGVIGVILAIPTILGMAKLAGFAGAKVLLPTWLLAAVLVVTLFTALLAGLFALRSLRHVEPANLLR
ncbi:MAG: ABC transporter permease [Gemmataceae bacterium]|nr:ABC transporter permease [Gemmataceae bacterium]